MRQGGENLAITQGYVPGGADLLLPFVFITKSNVYSLFLQGLEAFGNCLLKSDGR